jgi:hypothetical protein
MRSAAVTAYVVAILAIVIIAGCVGQGGESAEESKGGGIGSLSNDKGPVPLNESITPTTYDLQPKWSECMKAHGGSLVFSPEGAYFLESAWDVIAQPQVVLYDENGKVWEYRPDESHSIDQFKVSISKISTSNNAKFTVVEYIDNTLDLLDSNGALLWSKSIVGAYDLVGITPDAKYILLEGQPVLDENREWHYGYKVMDIDGNEVWSRDTLSDTLLYWDSNYLLLTRTSGNTVDKVSTANGEVLLTAKYRFSDEAGFDQVQAAKGEDAIYAIYYGENSTSLLLRYKMTANGLVEVWHKNVQDRYPPGISASQDGKYLAAGGRYLSLINNDGPTLWTYNITGVYFQTVSNTGHMMATVRSWINEQQFAGLIVISPDGSEVGMRKVDTTIDVHGISPNGKYVVTLIGNEEPCPNGGGLLVLGVK